MVPSSVNHQIQTSTLSFQWTSQNLLSSKFLNLYVSPTYSSYFQNWRVHYFHMHLLKDKAKSLNAHWFWASVSCTYLKRWSISWCLQDGGNFSKQYGKVEATCYLIIQDKRIANENSTSEQHWENSSFQLFQLKHRVLYLIFFIVILFLVCKTYLS